MTNVLPTYRQRLRLLFLQAGHWVLLFAILITISRLWAGLEWPLLVKLVAYVVGALTLFLCVRQIQVDPPADQAQRIGFATLLLCATVYMFATPQSDLMLGTICFSAILFNSILTDGVRASIRWYAVSALLYAAALMLRQFFPVLRLTYQMELLFSLYLLPLVLSWGCIRFGTRVIRYLDEALQMRQELEADLLQRDLQYEQLLQSMNEGFVIVDENEVFRYVNDRFCEIFGFAREELLKRRNDDVLFYDEANLQILQRQTELRTHRQRSTYELASRHKNGTPIHLLISAMPNLDAAGQFCGTTSVVMDITERKLAEAALHMERAMLSERVEERTASLRAATSALQQELQERKQIEKALRKAEGEYRTLFDNIPLGIYRSSLDGRQIRVNPALVSISGYRNETEMLDLLRNVATDWYVDPNRRATFQQLLADEGVVDHFESEIHHYQSHEPIWISESAILVRNADNEPLYYQGTVQDITERKQFEEAQARLIEQLAKVARLKDEFLASMSHELRTPLNSILGMAEALQDQIYGELSERQLKALGTIETSGRHLLALINDILDLAKIESGQVELAHDTVDVSAVCESCVRLIQPVARKKQLTVDCELDPAIRVMMADGRRLKQLLINLLSNAQKFTPEGGTIGLDVRPGDGPSPQVLFTVWDTGVGIAEEAQAHLFDPFVQVDSSLSRAYEGTGLGLALVKGVAELHGGDVTVDSAPGKGSRFVVALPWLLPENMLEQKQKTVGPLEPTIIT